jgi:4-hydroxybenzoate polyprenyltransferase
MALLSQPVETKDLARPLCVDLDQTLIFSDLLWESLLSMLRSKPWLAFACPFWLLKGRAHLKRKLFEHSRVAIDFIPYNVELIEWLRAEKRGGRTLVLVSAADDRLVQKVARHLDLFDAAWGSDGTENKKGAAKLHFLEQKYGDNFDYCGDSSADLVIWRKCKGAVLVNASPALQRKAQAEFPILRTFPGPKNRLALLKALRPAHWVKNLLIFVPLITSHRIGEPPMLVLGLIAFAAFSLIASGVYVVNDLVDLESDRKHEHKQHRPFASGRLSLLAGLILPFPLFIGGLALGALLPTGAQVVLLVYLALTSLYSFWLKRKLLLDVLSLALLYTLRIVAGHETTGIPYSPWLLSFSAFLFFSLAFCKRASELNNLRRRGGKTPPGRGYHIEDENVITIAGIASGFAACIVLILYMNSTSIQHLYAQPQFLWLLTPAFLYWICRIWMLTARGQVHEDPILFALHDRSTYAVAIWSALLLLLASHHWFPDIEFIR